MAILLLLMSLTGYAQTTPEERALILNEEMNFLMKAAPQVRLYAAPGNAQSSTRRSGPAPSQMPAGVESLENRYFSDEVRFQAAASDKITTANELMGAPIEEEEEADYRIDGAPPKPVRP